jgi:hypothetical protein
VYEITEDSIVDTDGNAKKVDTIICATEFDVSYKPHFPIVGQNRVELGEKWKTCPESYLGITVPSIPNFITFIGPTWPVENGSVMGLLGEIANYAVKFIRKMENEFIRSIAPKQTITDAFNAHTQEFIKQTVWSTEIRSWHKSMYNGSTTLERRLTMPFFQIMILVESMLFSPGAHYTTYKLSVRLLSAVSLWLQYTFPAARMGLMQFHIRRTQI